MKKKYFLVILIIGGALLAEVNPTLSTGRERTEGWVAFDDTVSVKGDNIFMIKATYRFNL